VLIFSLVFCVQYEVGICLCAQGTRIQ
jgi:hypothetical protein